MRSPSFTCDFRSGRYLRKLGRGEDAKKKTAAPCVFACSFAVACSRVLLPAFSHSTRAKHNRDSTGHDPGIELSPAATSGHRCGPNLGCGQAVDVLGDHALACPRTGLQARRAKVVERAWLRMARDAEGQVVPQQWLAHTTAPGKLPEDRTRVDMVVYGATATGAARCCDARAGTPLPTRSRPPSRAARAACCSRRSEEAGPGDGKASSLRARP